MSFIQQFLGHNDIKTTMVYAKVTQKNLKYEQEQRKSDAMGNCAFYIENRRNELRKKYRKSP
jgi:hypothetical protein